MGNDGWKKFQLGDLIQIKHGFAFKGEYFCDEPTRDVLLTPGNFALGGGFKDDKLKYYRGPVPEEYVLRTGDLIVTMTDLSKAADTLGYPAIVPDNTIGLRYLHNQRLGLINITKPDELEARFLDYLMCTRSYRHHVLAGSTGTTVKHTSPTKIREHVADIPPLPIQQRIADILGKLDDKIELNRRMNRTLEKMAAAIFKSWFIDFLPVRAKMAAKQQDEMLPACASHADRLLPQAEPDTWFVYALECNDGSLYIGQTEDLRQRWLQHTGGKGGRWTKAHPPQRVAYWEKQPSREAAVEREKWLKTGFGRKWLKKKIACLCDGRQAAIARTQTGDPTRAKAEGRLPASAGQAGDPTSGSLPAEIVDLFPDAFDESDLGQIPKGWSVSTLGAACAKPQYGYTASASDCPIGPRLLRITDINKLPWIEWNSVPYCEASETDVAKFQLKRWYIVIARMADPGHAALIEDKEHAVFASYLIRFRPLDINVGRYLQYWFRSPAYWNLIHGRKTGSTRATLNAKVLSELPLLCPSSEVVKAFRALVDPFRNRVVHNVRQNRRLAGLRDTLLPKLLSGEIELPEAEAVAEEVT